MNKELLEKYCNNTCTKEELSFILKWFEGSARTPEGEALLFNIWEELNIEDNNLKIDFDSILDEIHHKVNLARSKKLLEEANQNLIRYRRKEYFIKTLTRVAAILMLPSIGFGLYMFLKSQSTMRSQISVNQAYNEIYSSVDAITKVTLPDGSNVWLNHRSTLKYPAMFHGDSRNVELIGEGYFEVAHNPKIPFIVKVGEIQVTASGTTFNIMAYPNEDRIETSLIKGQVDLQRKGPDGKLITMLKMKPTELAIFQMNNNEISTRAIHDDRYFSWKDGKLVFSKEPLMEVANKLSRWFNVDIQLRDSELFNLTYTATFINETLSEVMELLTLITPIDYSISNREKLNDGTFTKRRVILSYRKNRIIKNQMPMVYH